MRRQGSPGPASPGPMAGPLDALFSPRTVAIVGASADSAKWGHILSRRALSSPGDRTVLLVNRSGGEVLGRPTYPSAVAAAAAAEQRVDLAVLCVPAGGFVAAVTDAVAAGARALVGITAGLAESGAEGARLEAEALAVARAGGAVLLGPNCLGIVDTGSGLQLAHAELPPGDVAVLSQSGNLVLDLAGLLADRGLGVSRFVSLGNQADLGLVDFLRACVHHAGTRAVAVYTEDVGDGRAFLEAARALRDAGKPLVLLAPGRSEAAIRGAASHTGSLTSSSMVVDAACAASGAHRVDHPTQLADLLVALRAPRRMAGRRVAILTDGGGHGAVAADALAAAGLSTPALTSGLTDDLAAALWGQATVSNPVDLAGAGEQDVASYARGVELLLASGQVDGVLLTGFFGGYSTEQSNLTAPELAAAARMAASVAAQDKPLVVQTIHPTSPSAELLRAAGIPVHRDVDRACAVLAGLCERSPSGLAEPLPPPGPPVAATSYDAARALFADVGIAFPTQRTVTDAGELDRALAAMGYPVVLKATGRLHKSEGGGVVLGLADRAAAEAAYDDLVARLAPPAVSVEEMADLDVGVELIVGAVRDRTFGPVVMVGLGGVLTEVLGDTACAIAPVTPAAARDLLLTLRGAAVLAGVRGRAPVDLDALADLVSRVSVVAAAHPELVELELNPVLAGPSGVLALDARVVADGQVTSRR
ncbi:acetate--CoA ligase family protein [Nocardioides mangrovi]|uniref:Acetate--CoA ligase family protein n=1 Tax=Nocardioides mangrovi TaxID=2874580 RepID=A0ABS7U9S8_9ACTN|nr:acetate--CoA ligase family protein [Nocardioides mangrovi]MBZ5737733.1 acetate--CoA ligase family protein [Nocardioides mangrovi]